MEMKTKIFKNIKGGETNIGRSKNPQCLLNLLRDFEHEKVFGQRLKKK